MGEILFWRRCLCFFVGLAAGRGFAEAKTARLWAVGSSNYRLGQIIHFSLEVIQMTLACLFATVAAPQIKEAAVLWAGLGVLLGRMSAARCWQGMAAPASVWVIICLPATGVLCCLGGILAATGSGHPALGAAMMLAVAAPTAWLQFGSEAGIAVLVALCGMLYCLWERGLLPLLAPEKGQETPAQQQP